MMYVQEDHWTIIRAMDVIGHVADVLNVRQQVKSIDMSIDIMCERHARMGKSHGLQRHRSPTTSLLSF